MVHFTLTNPEWKPPTDSEGFITAFRGQAVRETEAMPTLPEEQLNENPMYQSLNSLDAAGGVYSSLAGSILQVIF